MDHFEKKDSYHMKTCKQEAAVQSVGTLRAAGSAQHGAERGLAVDGEVPLLRYPLARHRS